MNLLLYKNQILWYDAFKKGRGDDMEQQSSFREKVSIREQPYAYTYLCPAVASLIRCNFLINKKQGAIQDGSLQGEVVIQDEKGQQGIRALRIDDSNNILDGVVAFSSSFYKALDFLLINCAVLDITRKETSTVITLNSKDFAELLYGSKGECAAFDFNRAKKILLKGLNLLAAVSFEYLNCNERIQMVRLLDSIESATRSEIIRVKLSRWFCLQLTDRPKKMLLPLNLFQVQNGGCYYIIGRKLAEHTSDMHLQKSGLKNVIKVETLCKQSPTLALSKVKGSKKGNFILGLYVPLCKAFRALADNDVTSTAAVFINEKNETLDDEMVRSMGQNRFLELRVKFELKDFPYGFFSNRLRFE